MTTITARIYFDTKENDYLMTVKGIHLGYYPNAGKEAGDTDSLEDAKVKAEDFVKCMTLAVIENTPAVVFFMFTPCRPTKTEQVLADVLDGKLIHKWSIDLPGDEATLAAIDSYLDEVLEVGD